MPTVINHKNVQKIEMKSHKHINIRISMATWMQTKLNFPWTIYCIYLLCLYVIGSKKSRFPRTQFQDTLFNIQNSHTLTDNFQCQGALFLMLVRCPQVLGWSLNGSISPRQVRQLGVIHHKAGWWVWSWIKLLWLICETENTSNKCHLAVCSIDIAFAHHFMAPHHFYPPLL